MPQLLFFQLPSSLPLPKQPNTGSEENAEPASTSSIVTREERRSSLLPGTKMKELPGGLMGKILVYKSGKVKMKIGNALFDVSIQTVNCRVYLYTICSPCNTQNSQTAKR